MSFIFYRRHGSTVGVGCDSVNITRVDQVDRYPPDRHQQHVRKLRLSIALSENQTLEMLSWFWQLWATRGCIAIVWSSSDGQKMRKAWVVTCDRGRYVDAWWAFDIHRTALDKREHGLHRGPRFRQIHTIERCWSHHGTDGWHFSRWISL